MLALASIASCSRAGQPGTQAAAELGGARPLALYAAQRLVVTPTGGIRADYDLGWAQQLGGLATAQRLDTTIVRAFQARGLAPHWIWPADLVASYERNRTYATNPYRLAVRPLLAPTFVAGQKFGEPLSSQLRTMIALHEDARMVLVPVELRFEREGMTGSVGRAVLRAVLLDPRFAEARFVGDVRGDTTSVAARSLESVAARLADLFVAP